jgi:hypothetical protein
LRKYIILRFHIFFKWNLQNRSIYYVLLKFPIP